MKMKDRWSNKTLKLLSDIKESKNIMLLRPHVSRIKI